MYEYRLTGLQQTVPCGTVLDLRSRGRKFESHPWLLVPMPTQRAIPLGSVNEHQLMLGRKRQVWFVLDGRCDPLK